MSDSYGNNENWELREQYEQLASRWPVTREIADEILAVAEAADASEDSLLGFFARSYWVQTSYHMGYPPALRIAATAWCLRYADAHPEQVHPDQLHGVLWAVKGHAEDLGLHPDVPIDAVRALTDDYGDRLRRAGNSLYAHHGAQMQVALVNYDVEAADRHAALRDAAVRDDMADCEGCEITNDLRRLALTQRWQSAVERGLSYLDQGRSSCHNQPHSVQAQLLRPLTETDDFKRAEKLFRSAWRKAARTEGADEPVAELVQWRAWSGKPAEASDMIATWLEKMDRPHAQIPGVRLQLLTAFASALGHLRATEPERQLAGSTVDALWREWSDEAREIAARFDARNGTDAALRATERDLTEPMWAGARG